MTWGAFEALPTIFPGVDAVPRAAWYAMSCRSFSQFSTTLRGLIDPVRFCVFCEKERAHRPRGPIRTDGGWMLIANEFPHSGIEAMYLIVPIRHLTDPAALKSTDWASLGRLFKFCRHNFVPSGGMIMRFGDPARHAGTIEHLHMNVIAPIPGKEYRPPLAKDIAEIKDDFLRMIGFRDELVRRGGTEWLFSEDGLRATRP
jgi:diadenosine tetraphosphate (Ap4A) HIT family hydrolase